jgi:tetratricopeptide (TPR) repeat protein
LDRGELEGLVEETLTLATRLRREKRYDEAAALLLDVLGHGIYADRVFFQLGNVYFDAGDLARAEYSYRRATEVNPNYANAHHNLGAIYKRQKKTAASLKAQRKAMMLELRGKSQNQRPLSPEAARWARGVGVQGIVAVALFLALLIGLLSLL